MARIRRWKERLLIAWFTLFASVVWARAQSRTPENRSGTGRSLVVTGNHGKRAWGVTFSANKPYVQAFSAYLMPVVLPIAVGAFTASAGASADPGGVAANATASCFVCITSQAPPCPQTAATCCKACHTADGVCTGGGAGGTTDSCINNAID